MPNIHSSARPGQSRFKRRLLYSGLGLLALVVLVVTTGLMASQQHTLLLERSAAAQRVYASYRAVSDHAYRKLSAMAEIVGTGSARDIDARFRNQQALRDALEMVKTNIDAEVLLYEDAETASTIAYFTEIASLAEQIIRASEAVQQATAAGDLVTASGALKALRSPAMEGAFNRAIDSALEEQLLQVRQTEREAADLTNTLNRMAPFLLLVLAVIGAVLMVSTWRALSHSLAQFTAAIRAYRSGDFSHRINHVGEAEFAELAHALNGMAAEVEMQRERERASQVNLEKQISMRTSELELSNEKLASASEMRKQFLADISHELRTPLTIMRGEADVALRGDSKTVEQYEDALRRVREQSIHTARLVQDLLFVARTEDGKAPISLRAEAIMPLVQEVCADMRKLASERGIGIVDYYHNTDLVAAVDAGRIKQVITILIDNAIKYSHPDGEIAVVLSEADQCMELRVVDGGIGLSAEQSAKAFTRFYRGNEGVNSPVGTGLGLPVAKAIVDAHQGEIALEGVEALGTTAIVRLPLETRLKAVS